MHGKLLLLGGTGFVGAHLAARMRDRFSVRAFGRALDVRDRPALLREVAAFQPDCVVNLAALTTVRETVQAPRATYDIMFTGLLNLFESLEEIGFRGRVLQVSSSEVYGHPQPQDLPLTELSPIRPMSPYAVGKMAAEMLCFEWAQRGLFDVMVARPFTHIGPGQSARFAIARFADQIAQAKAGATIEVGNLSATRDITDVRDVVGAYDAILDQGESGMVYNVCSESEVTVRDILDQMIAISGKEILVQVDVASLRAAEQQRLRGSAARLREKTGWRPRIPLSQTLTDMLLTVEAHP
jgi:GDP-4-dehydro-6-deoxy-D-mannose reductase